MDGESRLWLIRHALVQGLPGIIHHADAPADTTDNAGFARLRAELPASNRVFCSPARRALDSALALGLEPVIETAFREQDFGAWTGRRHADLAVELGTAYIEFWRSPATNRPPGGESFADQISRVAAGLAVLPAGDVILVVHSGTIRAALALALDLPADSALRFVIDPLSLTRIDRLEKSWRIVAVNRRC